MADKTGIEWCDSTWNPVRSRARVSPGCVNCYAETMAARFCGPGQPYEGLAVMTKSGPRWTGQVRLIEEHLEDPLRWKKPRRIFVNSMSDLFHEGLPFEQIDRVFAIMALAPQHTFQVLTKRPARMLEYLTQLCELETRADTVARAAEHLGKIVWDARGGDYWLYRNASAEQVVNRRPWPGWPLPNVWLGVSVEDQQRADDRIPLLLQTPAAVRFLSCEPLLSAIDLGRAAWIDCDQCRGAGVMFGPDWDRDNARPCRACNHLGKQRAGPYGALGLDWIIVGGESGPGARPCDLVWVAGLVEQCRAAGVACFVKQLGSVPVMDEEEWWQKERHLLLAVRNPVVDGKAFLRLKSHKGGAPEEWPDFLRVREFPAEAPR